MKKVKSEVTDVNTSLATVGEASTGLQRMEVLKLALLKLKQDKDKPYIVSDLSELGIGLGSVKDIKDQKALAMAYITIKTAAKHYEEAMAELGWESEEEFKIGGGTPEQWKEVIQSQWKFANHEENIKELEALIKEGEKFVKEEELEQIHLDKVKKFAEKFKG